MFNGKRSDYQGVSSYVWQISKWHIIISWNHHTWPSTWDAFPLNIFYLGKSPFNPHSINPAVDDPKFVPGFPSQIPAFRASCAQRHLAAHGGDPAAGRASTGCSTQRRAVECTEAAEVQGKDEPWSRDRWIHKFMERYVYCIYIIQTYIYIYIYLYVCVFVY